jgi:DNA-binding NarL/FixJ family response regulator
MLYPQLLVFERDGLLAALLRPLAEQRKWFIREPRRADACVRLLRRRHPAVLVIRVETDVLPALALVQRVAWLCPETQMVVSADVANAELLGLALHLGARYVLMPPQPRNRLPTVVENLMDAAIARLRAAGTPQRQGATTAADDELPEADLEDE